MTDMTLTNIGIMVGIASAVFGIVSAGMRALMEYLTARFGSDMTVAQQSAQCRFDHETIGTQLRQQQSDVTMMIQAQNEHIAHLLEQNGEQLKHLRDSSHNAELRHTITVNKLDMILGVRDTRPGRRRRVQWPGASGVPRQGRDQRGNTCIPGALWITAQVGLGRLAYQDQGRACHQVSGRKPCDPLAVWSRRRGSLLRLPDRHGACA